MTFPMLVSLYIGVALGAVALALGVLTTRPAAIGVFALLTGSALGWLLGLSIGETTVASMLAAAIAALATGTAAMQGIRTARQHIAADVATLRNWRTKHQEEVVKLRSARAAGNAADANSDEVMEPVPELDRTSGVASTVLSPLVVALLAVGVAVGVTTSKLFKVGSDLDEKAPANVIARCTRAGFNPSTVRANMLSGKSACGQAAGVADDRQAVGIPKRSAT